MRLALDMPELDDFSLDAFADPFGPATSCERLECFACLGTGENAHSGDCGFCLGEGVRA